MTHQKKKAAFKNCLATLLLISVLQLTAVVCTAGSMGKTLIPLGNAVGINMQSEGVMVVGIPEMLSDGVTHSPAFEAGVVVGDIITRINTQPVSSTEDLKTALSALDGSPISVKLARGSSTVTLNLTPHKAADGHCELGLWMRDGIAGIGTLTFYDPQTGIFGALGHAVNDMETGVIIPLRAGSITRSSVTDVVQGKVGAPGQLRGTFNMTSILGTLLENSSCGIFGKMSENDLLKDKAALPIALSSEIKPGAATILSNVSGTQVTEYSVEVTRVYTGSEAVGRSMMLSVTDPNLLTLTGGIVQGMSGSPILQNGKIIGAVTHVLVNDPTRGYGISIEKMLASVDSAKELAAA